MTKTQTSLPPEVAKLSFEDAMAELEKLVRKLEDGSAKLDDAMDAYARGAMLKQHCEAKLREAEARIQKISVGETGKVSVSDL